MSTPYLSEIRIMSFSFPPKGWTKCDGALLPINQNQALFSLLGTTFGGNGSTNFRLPNLQGRVPIHMGSGHILGEVGGSESHTVSVTELPQHTHLVQASSVAATAPGPSNARVLAKSEGADVYAAPSNLVTMESSVPGSTGGSQAHTNLQPFLALNFCIALQGIYPSPT
jgi:microcystin-dependent protein